MMACLRQILLALLMVLTLPVMAAGLGRMQVHSALGEPLQAEIELIESGEQTGSIVAAFGTASDYANAGLPDNAMAYGIYLSVLRHANNSRYLHLGSSRPINDPFLELLIKIDSANASVIRQYTLLLDPPYSRLGDVNEEVPALTATAKTDAPAIPSMNSAASEIGGSRAKKSDKSRKTSPNPFSSDAATLDAKMANKAVSRDASSSQIVSSRVQPPALNAVTGETYQTQSGDVFGKVAQRYQPEGVSLKKVMAAFYAANPDAFLNGDMNQLKVGQTLLIPTEEAMRGGSKVRLKKLSSDVLEQKVPSKDSPDAAKTIPAEPKYVLKVSPGESSQSVASHPSAEEMAATNSSGLLGDASAKSQQNSSKADVNNLTPDTESPAPGASSETNPDSTSATPEAEPDHSDVASQNQSAPAPKMSEAAGAIIQTSAANLGFWQELQTNMKWILLGMILPTLAFSAILILNQRRLAKQRDIQNLLDLESAVVNAPSADTVFDNHENSAPQLFADNPSSSQMPPMVPVSSDMHQQTQPRMRAFVNQPREQGESNIDIHEVDPLLEAEIYLSYGRQEQAEALLKQAIKKQPNNHHLTLGLLKIYFDTSKKEAFNALAKNLHQAAESGDEDWAVAWGKVVVMGSALDADNPLYNIEKLSTVENVVTPTPLQDVNTFLENDIFSGREQTASNSADISADVPSAMPINSEVFIEVPTTPDQAHHVSPSTDMLDLQLPELSLVEAKEDETEEPAGNNPNHAMALDVDLSLPSQSANDLATDAVISEDAQQNIIEFIIDDVQADRIKKASNKTDSRVRPKKNVDPSEVLDSLFAKSGDAD